MSDAPIHPPIASRQRGAPDAWRDTPQAVLARCFDPTPGVPATAAPAAQARVHGPLA